jgi:hypothetical protein
MNIVAAVGEIEIWTEETETLIEDETETAAMTVIMTKIDHDTKAVMIPSLRGAPESTTEIEESMIETPDEAAVLGKFFTSLSLRGNLLICNRHRGSDSHRLNSNNHRVDERDRKDSSISKSSAESKETATSNFNRTNANSVEAKEARSTSDYNSSSDTATTTPEIVSNFYELLGGNEA